MKRIAICLLLAAYGCSEASANPFRDGTAGGGGFVGTATSDLGMGVYDITGTGTGYIQYADVSLDASTIVGSAAGDIGHTDGVTLVPAVANKIIAPLYTIGKYAYSTAAYTGGGTVRMYYKTSSALVAASPTTNLQFYLVTTASNSSFMMQASQGSLGDTATATSTAFVNAPVTLQGTAYTNPGTAAGTLTLRTAYFLIDAP